MIQTERRLYRRDVTRRQTPQDRPNTGGSASLGGRLSDCGPCEDCRKTGAIQECAHCAPRGASARWGFDFRDESQLIGGSRTASRIRRLLEHAADCTWESDDVDVTCAYQTDQFGWALNVAEADPWGTDLTFSRRGGGGCDDFRWTYRNWDPFQCLCPNTMVLARDEVEGIPPDRLPCTICLQPGAHCPDHPQYPDGFRVTVPAALGGLFACAGDHVVTTGLQRCDNSDLPNDPDFGGSCTECMNKYASECSYVFFDCPEDGALRRVILVEPPTGSTSIEWGLLGVPVDRWRVLFAAMNLAPVECIVFHAAYDADGTFDPSVGGVLSGIPPIQFPNLPITVVPA